MDTAHLVLPRIETKRHVKQAVAQDVFSSGSGFLASLTVWDAQSVTVCSLVGLGHIVRRATSDTRVSHA